MSSGWALRSMSDLLLACPDHFVEDVRSDRIVKEKWALSEGKEGQMKAIISRRDLETKAGQKVLIDIESEIFGDPVIGETDSSGSELKPDVNQFPIQIETYRFFEAGTKKANERAFLKWTKKAQRRVANLMGRYRDHRMCRELLIPSSQTNSQGVTVTPSPTTLFGGNKSSISGLDNTCRLDCAEISKIKLITELSALPMQVKNSNGMEVEFFEMWISEFDKYWLKQDPVWQVAVRDGLPVGWDSPQFTGALGYWDGVLVKVWRSIIQGCHQGSPWRPECALLATTSAGASELVVGTNNKKPYLEHFPEAGTLMIRTAGGTDEELAYDNSGLTTAEKRYKFNLTGTTSYDHAKGNYITRQKNLSTVICYGAEIAGRAWGKEDEKVGDVWDAGMQMKLGIEAVFGESVVVDSDGNVPNYSLLRLFSDRPTY